MAAPRAYTKDGFELQFGTNHLGHFALTGLLIGAMAGRPDARVVTVSSGAHRIGTLYFDDLRAERSYNRWRRYGQSKLANLMFALELSRRLARADSEIKSMAAHPGYARTNLQKAAPPLADRIVMRFSDLFAQSAEMGALCQEYAATYPDLPSGAFIGPDGIGEQRGYPQIVTPSRAALNEENASRLWEISQELTGVSFEL
jgi:NAD(P)-dependent dehydrogenase (short-subunit alcohol dehydrogenase family)